MLFSALRNSVVQFPVLKSISIFCQKRNLLQLAQCAKPACSAKQFSVTTDFECDTCVKPIGNHTERISQRFHRRRNNWYQSATGKYLSNGNRYLHIDQTTWARINSGPDISSNELLSKNDYELIAEETLESLTTYFDEIFEKSPLDDTDAAYESGVLTIKLGKHGTYVINKQTPNKQIWLSSPTSGPKRYDFVSQTWIYKHDGKSMYSLLNSEIPNLVSLPNLDFEKNCSYGSRHKR